jgi:Domain of unknown function (DUF4157)
MRKDVQASTPGAGMSSPAGLTQSIVNGHAALRPEQVLQLQHTIGNTATTRLIAQRKVQAKLTVGATDDPYEREADRVAAQVMTQGMFISAAAREIPPGVRRKADRDSAQRLAITPVVQRVLAPDLNGSFDAGADVERRIYSSNLGGTPLPPKLRAEMEPKFGVDFSAVRVHTGGQSDQLNRSLGAQAFTHGNRIYMSAGKFNPESTDGRRLLAHEMTHVVQQGGAGKLNRSPVIQRKKKNTDAANIEYEQTGKVPEGAPHLFTLSLHVKTSAKVRGQDSTWKMLTEGTGHAWLELNYGPNIGNEEDLENQPDGDNANMVLKNAMLKPGDTAGFFPAASPNLRNKQESYRHMLKQIFVDLPGKVMVPDGMASGGSRINKDYAITRSSQLMGLSNYIGANKNHKYSLFRYNCTDFALGAVKAAGLQPPGGVTNAVGAVSPTLVYKQLYKSSVMGDKTVKQTQLKNAQNKAGQRYDIAHLTKKAQKRLDKRRAKQDGNTPKPLYDLHDDERVTATYKTPGFLSVAGIGMLRPGTEFGVTGVQEGTRVEIVLPQDGKTGWADAMEFENAMGAPYPGPAFILQPDQEQQQGEMPPPDNAENMEQELRELGGV